MKKIVALGDMHCGHIGGLTPPGWDDNDRYPAFKGLRKETWKAYKKIVSKVRKTLNPSDTLVVVCNGDAIDGNRSLSELVCPDRMEQVAMARKCLDMWKADKYLITAGTPYHVGKEESWEVVLGELMDAGVAPEHYLDVDGVMFYFRHKVGRSSVPYGRYTAPARSAVWNQLASAKGLVPEADVLCYSHVHYFSFCGNSDWLAMTLPSLQSVSDYGGRECDGTVDWGLVWFDVDKGKLVDWGTEITSLGAAAPVVDKV